MPLPRHILAIALLAAAPAAASFASEVLPCTGRLTGFGSGELACPLAAPAQRLRLDARFSGVHDDSQAALAATLDGAPLACEAGSRARIEGDAEGDTLVCRLSVAAAEAGRTLTVRLVWHHAEPTAVTLTRE